LLTQLGGALGDPLLEGGILLRDDRHHAHVVADEIDEYRHETEVHDAQRKAHKKAYARVPLRAGEHLLESCVTGGSESLQAIPELRERLVHSRARSLTLLGVLSLKC